MRTGLAHRDDRRPRGESRRVFFDRFAPPTTLVIVGAGQIAMSLTRFARELDMRTIVIDGRERYATRDRFPDADEIRVGMPSEIVAGVTPSKRVAVDSRRARLQVRAAGAAAACCARRSAISECSEARSAARRCASCLRDEGFTDDELSRIRTPIGLDIGGKSSPEVALSILAGDRGGSQREACVTRVSAPSCSSIFAGHAIARRCPTPTATPRARIRSAAIGFEFSFASTAGRSPRHGSRPTRARCASRRRRC